MMHVTMRRPMHISTHTCLCTSRCPQVSDKDPFGTDSFANDPFPPVDPFGEPRRDLFGSQDRGQPGSSADSWGDKNIWNDEAPRPAAPSPKAPFGRPIAPPPLAVPALPVLPLGG